MQGQTAQGRIASECAMQHQKFSMANISLTGYKEASASSNTPSYIFLILKHGFKITKQ